jgi:Domain of unknown function (DUF6438)
VWTRLILCAALLQAPASPAPVVITIERTACYGACPVYSLEITGDGTVTFQGRQFVRVIGRATATIPPEAVRQLVAEFERIHYFDLQNIYTAHITDLPTTTTSIRIGERFKKVVDHYGGPDELEKLEDRIDEVAGSDRWVKK